MLSLSGLARAIISPGLGQGLQPVESLWLTTRLTQQSTVAVEVRATLLCQMSHQPLPLVVSPNSWTMTVVV